MRRILSLVLLLVFGLPVAAPALGLSADSESSLPACCRRNGAHHCHMSLVERDSLLRGTQVRAIMAHCPAYPTTAATASHLSLFAPTAPARLTEGAAARILLPAAEAGRHVARRYAHPKRGPPTLLS